MKLAEGGFEGGELFRRCFDQQQSLRCFFHRALPAVYRREIGDEVDASRQSTLDERVGEAAALFVGAYGGQRDADRRGFGEHDFFLSLRWAEERFARASYLYGPEWRENHIENEESYGG